MSFFKKNKHWILIVAFVSCRAALTGEEAKIADLIQYQQKLRPKFEIQDAYKLMYQGNLGIDHIMGDTAAAKEYLEYEISSIRESEFPDEPLIENISADGSIVRINLRPFERLGMNSGKLWRVMVYSTEHYPQVAEKFLHAWALYVKLCEKRALAFDIEKVRFFDEQMKANNYRSAHHSTEYVSSYKPAYRVVLLREFENLFHLPNY
ncbi:hypothetical protein JNM05_08830 [bacterium]|nr:hypothetical protein [bacterium]